jgi:hypothetical protein
MGCVMYDDICVLNILKFYFDRALEWVMWCGVVFVYSCVMRSNVMYERSEGKVIESVMRLQ